MLGNLRGSNRWGKERARERDLGAEAWARSGEVGDGEGHLVEDSLCPQGGPLRAGTGQGSWGRCGPLHWSVQAKLQAQ